MSTNSHRCETGRVPTRTSRPPGRAKAARYPAGARRMGARWRAAVRCAPRAMVDASALAIEEVIARFVDANPPQLYRGW